MEIDKKKIKSLIHNQVGMLYQRKQMIYSENKVFPYIQVKDLRHDLIDKCRKIIRVNSQGHPWADMDDQQLLQSAQLYQFDSQTKESGVTLAGVLIFAPDPLILNVCTAHRTDLILRKFNVDRYDDRDLVRTNLIDSYDRILSFIQKHLSDPFYLEGVERISLRDIIFREIASNMLIHREYLSGIPARLIIKNGEVVTENANRPHGFGPLDLDTFIPYPKNPIIGAFFREIYRADELGSGMRKLMKYGEAYGGERPQMIEGDLFRMIVKVPEFKFLEKGVHDDVKGVHDETKGVHDDIKGVHDEAKGVHDEAKGVHDEAKGVHDEAKGVHDIKLTSTMYQILNLLSLPKSTSELLKALNYPRRTRNYNKALKELIDTKLVEMTIPDKPKSKKQKYRITTNGKKLINLLEKQRKS